MSISIFGLKRIADNVFNCTREKVNICIEVNKVIVKAPESVIVEIEKKLDKTTKAYVEFVTEVDL